MSEELKKALLSNIKTLAAIYCLLACVFLAGRVIADKLPAPYNTKSIPSEITPWLK